MAKQTFLRIAFLSLPLSLNGHGAWSQSNSVKFSEDAHGHTFYSERVDGALPSIDYLVCNRTEANSDFFWTVAGFGVSEDSLSSFHCLQKTDYVREKGASQPISDFIPAKVFVRSESAEVPTVYWCEYGGFDRCDDGLVNSLAFWSSTLREFAESGTDEPFRPLVSVEAALEGGRYQIDIKRAEDTGELVVIARTFQLDGIRVEPGAGIEAKPGILGDFLPVSGEAISTGLSTEMPALAVFTSAASDLGVRVFFENRTPNPVELVIAVVSDTGIVLRLDSVGLPPIELQ